MQILFLSRWFPYPPDNGSKIRVYNLLRGLAENHEVTLLSFLDHPDEEAGVEAMRAMCCEVRTVLRDAFQPWSWRSLLGFFATAPRSVLDTFSPMMAQQIRDVLSEQGFDLIIASQEGTAAYARCFGDTPAIFEEVETAVLYERWAKASNVWVRFRNGLTWAKQRNYLSRLLQNYRACTVVSSEERSLLCKAVANVPCVQVIPNCVNLNDYANVGIQRERRRLIFTGSFHYDPNYEAMVWFLREVHPKIAEEVGDIEVMITGDHADRALPRASGVTLTGRVDDVRVLLASATASLAPIFFGGGTRLKILEAMASKTPVVSTTKGAEGLEVEPGKHLLIADTPTEFAEATLRILKDSDLQRELGENSFRLIAEKYDWAAVMPGFMSLVKRITEEEA